MRFVLGVTAAAALIAAACGSTAEPVSSGDAFLGADGGAPSAAPDAGTGARAADEPMPEMAPDPSNDGDDIGSAGSAGSGAAPAGAARRGGSPPGAIAGGLLPVGPNVRGVDDKTMQLGLVTTDPATAAGVATALGGTGGGDHWDFDNDKVNAAALHAVNSRGGIAGRKVEPVYYSFNEAGAISPSGRREANQEACAHWTEDNQVFAFSPLIFPTEVIVECAARTKTPMVNTGVYQMPITQQRFASMSDYWYGTPYFIADRRERAMGKFLLSHGFFGDRAKVGLMIENASDIRRGVQNGLKPILAAAGIDPVVEIHYPDHFESPWPNYVLQMKAAGVTHIVWSSTSLVGFPPLFMMRASEDQRYRPKWALGSDNGPTHVRDLNAPREQLANVQAMGWRPNHDLYTDNAPPQSSNARICDEAMQEYGQPPGHRSALSRCEFLFFLKAAFERADVVSPSGLAAGVARLGSSYPSTVTIGGATRFGPGRHDGVAIVRHLAWDHDADHFKYTTEAEEVPE